MRTEVLEELVSAVFAKAGLPAEAAHLVGQALIAADLEGLPSHGVRQVPTCVARLLGGSVSMLNEAELVRDGGAAVVLAAAARAFTHPGFSSARVTQRRSRLPTRSGRTVQTHGMRHETRRRKGYVMKKQQVRTTPVREPMGHFSQAISIEAKGRLVFVSGMTPRIPDGLISGIGDIDAQTRKVCENSKSAVEAAGGRSDDVCRVDVYVHSIEHFDKIHKIRREYFKAPPPSSAMVEVTKMVSPEYLIETNATAVAQS